MSEVPKHGVAHVQPKVAVAEQAKEPVVDMKVPKEYSSKNKSVHIVADGSEITLTLAPLIAEEIGAYRRCNVKVHFREGGQVVVIPQLEQ